MSFRSCAVIPTYENPLTLRAVVEGVRRFLPDVVVVDDGSQGPSRGLAEALARAGQVRLVRHPHNRGKGAAVKSGFREAQALGASHVLQVDADGQHCLEDIPRFLAAARSQPEALVLGTPLFDESLPRGRALARGISTFWVGVEVGAGVIRDPQCGFRVYPLLAALEAGARGDHMEFDQELPVRMVWRGVPVLNLPTRVRYLAPEEGGVSHFDLLRDNLRISAMHTGLVLQVAWRGRRGSARRSSEVRA